LKDIECLCPVVGEGTGPDVAIRLIADTTRIGPEDELFDFGWV